MRLYRFWPLLLAVPILTACAGMAVNTPQCSVAESIEIPINITEGLNTLITFAGNEKISDKEFGGLVKSVLLKTLDLEFASKKLFGKEWPANADSHQREEFRQLFQLRLIKTAIQRRHKFKSIKIEYKNFFVCNYGSQGIDAVIVWPDGDRDKIKFLLMGRESGSWRLYEIQAGEVSIFRSLGYKGIHEKSGSSFGDFLGKVKQIESEKDEAKEKEKKK